MGKLRNDFNAFKEDQRQVNQSLMEHLRLIRAQNESLSEQRHQCIENRSALIKIRIIFSKIAQYDERIRTLEKYHQVI